MFTITSAFNHATVYHATTEAEAIELARHHAHVNYTTFVVRGAMGRVIARMTCTGRRINA